MSVNDIRDFIFENDYKRIGFPKENSYCSMKRWKRKDLLLLANKLIKKVPNPRNAKEHYESFLGKKSSKSVKQSEVITYQPKTFDITEYPKSSHKLSKTIRKGEKVDSNSSL